MMAKKMRSALSLLMAVVMCLSLCNVTALAAGHSWGYISADITLNSIDDGAKLYYYYWTEDTDVSHLTAGDFHELTAGQSYTSSEFCKYLGLGRYSGYVLFFVALEDNYLLTSVTEANNQNQQNHFNIDAMKNSLYAGYDNNKGAVVIDAAERLLGAVAGLGYSRGKNGGNTADISAKISITTATAGIDVTAGSNADYVTAGDTVTFTVTVVPQDPTGNNIASVTHHSPELTALTINGQDCLSSAVSKGDGVYEVSYAVTQADVDSNQVTLDVTARTDYTCQIYLGSAQSPVSTECTVTASDSTLINIAKTLTVTADSDSKTYDGTPLTKASYTYTQDVLKEGDVLTAAVTGSQTDAGESANQVTSVTISRNGVDVTGQYHIETADGTLTVTRRNVTLTSASDSKAYDTTPLTNHEVTVGGEGFAAGEGAAYDVTGSQTQEGSSPNTFTYTLNEGTKADNYNITKVEGTLTVTRPTQATVIYTWMEGYGWPADAGVADPLSSGNTDTVNVIDLGSYVIRDMVSVDGLDEDYFSIENCWYVADSTAQGGYREVTAADITALQGGASITLYGKLNYANTYAYQVVYQYHYKLDSESGWTDAGSSAPVTAAIDIKQAGNLLSAAGAAAPETSDHASASVADGETVTYKKGTAAGDVAVTGVLAEGSAVVTVKYYFEKATRADVTVTKTFSGISDLPETFQISYELNGIQTLTTAGLSPVTNSDGSKTYTWIISNVAMGTVLSFVESGYGVTGYSVVTSDTNVDLVVGTGDNTAVFTNDYSSKTYAVSFVLEGGGAVLSGSGRNHKFEAVLDGGDGGMQYNVWTVDGAASDPVASVYTLSYGEWLNSKDAMEFGAGSQAGDLVYLTAGQGYSWQLGEFYLKDGENGAYGTAYTTLADAMQTMIDAGTQTITYYTKAARDTGSLTIQKTVAGLTGTAENGQHTFRFVITSEDVIDGAYPCTVGETTGTVTFTGGSAAVELEVTGNTNASLTISGLPTGAYSVAEDYAAVDGHRLTNHNANGMTVDVAKDQTVTASVKNQYAKADGAGSFTLTFDKALVGDEGEVYMVTDGQFAFQVQEKVTEYKYPDDPNNTERVDKWVDMANGTAAAGGSVTITVPFEDDVDEVTWTDTFTSYHSYRVTESKGTIPGMTYDDTVYELTVKVEWTWSSADSKWSYEVIGVEAHDVTDETAPIQTQAAVANGSVSLTTADGGNAFTNVWTQVDVTVRKEFTGVTALDPDFSITITAPNGTVAQTLTLDDEHVVKGAGYFEWNIELPALADGTYTFTEHNAAVSGMNHSLTFQFAARILPDGKWSYGQRTTVNGLSFNMELSSEDYLNGTMVLREAQVRLTNAYTGTSGPVLPPDTPKPTPDPDPIPEVPAEEIPEEDIPMTDLPEEGPAEEIPDEDVPMTDLPEEPAEEIPEEDVPMADVPETGDNLAVWVAAAGVSGLGLVWITLTGRKRKQESND